MTKNPCNLVEFKTGILFVVLENSYVYKEKKTHSKTSLTNFKDFFW